MCVLQYPIAVDAADHPLLKESCLEGVNDWSNMPESFVCTWNVSSEFFMYICTNKANKSWDISFLNSMNCVFAYVCTLKLYVKYSM